MRKNGMAAAGMAATISVLTAGGTARSPEIAGPIVVKLVEGQGRFEPKSLELRPGQYIFMVTNQGVDHPVDFVLKLTRTDRVGDDPSGRPLRGSRLSHRVGDGETASTS